MIMRPVSKAIVSGVTSMLDLIWDKFFHDVQTALNGIQRNASFTMSAASSRTVADSRVTSASHISIAPANAAAGTLQAGSAALYTDAASTTPGVSFVVKTADGSSAAGTELFTYAILG